MRRTAQKKRKATSFCLHHFTPRWHCSAPRRNLSAGKSSCHQEKSMMSNQLLHPSWDTEIRSHLELLCRQTPRIPPLMKPTASPWRLDTVSRPAFTPQVFTIPDTRCLSPCPPLPHVGSHPRGWLRILQLHKCEASAWATPADPRQHAHTWGQLLQLCNCTPLV